MSNTYLEFLTVEELQQRNEFAVMQEVECCGLKCLTSPDDGPVNV